MNSREQDIEKWLSDTATDDQRRFDYLKTDINGKSLLDFGCGNGGFLLKAREICSNVAGVELEDYARKQIVSKGSRVEKEISSFKKKYDFITLFHVLEHLPNPIEYLELCKTYLTSSTGGA